MRGRNVLVRGEVSLRIKLKEPRLAAAIAAALRPDDTRPPPGVRLNQLVEGDTIVYSIAFSGKGKVLYTIRNIMDELLEHVQTASKSVENIK